jgi:hypothetical protein
MNITDHSISLVIGGIAIIIVSVLIWIWAVWMDKQFAKKNKL